MTIKVALLGATGMLGRECSSYLFDYADIEVVYYVGSASTQGKPFYDIWKNKEFILKSHYGSIWKELEVDPRIKDVTIIGFDDLLTKKDEVDVVFSFLAPRFGNLDEQLIQEGFTVLSNSPYKRLDTNVPLCIPEVNKYVLENRVATKYVKSPGCCTIGISLGIVPIVQKYGLQEINITTFQSLSGRGDDFYDHEAVVGNIYPIGQTAENQDTYIENEIRKLFNLPELSISVSSNRVYVQRNHSLDVKLRTKIPPSSKEELEHLFQSCRHIIYTNEVGQPRPGSLHNKMKVMVGNLRVGTNTPNDVKFTVIVDNIVRGAFGNSFFNFPIS